MAFFNWQHIDTVLLDMDGTLLDLHFDNHFWHDFLPERYALFHNMPLKDAQKKLQSMINDRIGTLQWYCLDHWSELVGMDIMQLKQETKHKILIRPHAEAFLTQLKAAGKQTVLVTNSHPKGLELKLDVTNIDTWLDIIISSHEFNTPKEDQTFWKHLSDKVKFDPTRTLFIDDTPRILKSAQTFGIKHLLCISAPDSQKPQQENIPFLHTAHFDALLPIQ